MKVIGITGPTGAGKTTALRAAADLGGAVIDCDKVYHEQLATNKEMQAALLDRFGTLDRKAIAAAVFADAEALRFLNRATHRFVGAEVARQVILAEEDGHPFAAVDAIALIESGLGAWCDATIAVLAPPELRIARVMARDGLDEQAARRRAGAQQKDTFFTDNCTHTLYNTGTPEAFYEQARALLEKILTKHEGGLSDV